ncbi:methionine import ATP-binding protein MetN [Actinoplanes cyaneus]|uniref:Methionine import ATP-binding protein MetN n=1 Tax=Actinoplanes cyaneus TaxID=52696 RepID=A0A919IQS9_9ACTN|nr:methionine ABC transporter ATP-binding protein [Actinoplanes cyaneus]MCW2142277.1 D-methionine transport system ATP-binding protein [Actinoplanes cyaneus]GID69296.1 methionine import ATP-binding protein MetN [Actinoplanes cyaneus]
MTHVRLKNVSKTFTRGRDGSRVVALDDVSLEVAKGEVFGVIGHSGAGKSTLIRLINGLETPTTGEVWVGDHEITALAEKDQRAVRRDIGMIFQQFNLFRSRTIAGNVAYPLKVAGVDRAERDRRVARLLDFVGLLDRAHDHPEQLSGGQKQRVGIARALATEPSLLLADEATSALDPKTTAEVLALLGRVNKELGVTILLITHELDVIRTVADRVAVMDSGRIAEAGPVYDVFANPASDVAADFVRDALRDRPSPEVLARLRRTHPGRLVTVAVRARTGLAKTFFAHGVTADLVFGGISELQERAVGSLTFELTGPADGIDAALAELRAGGIDVTEEND